jgi:hypothetical protein
MDRLMDLARETANHTNGHEEYRLEGNDLLEAAIIAVEKAAHWMNPQFFHPGNYEHARDMANLRVGVALAVEMRALRKVLESRQEPSP